MFISSDMISKQKLFQGANKPGRCLANLLQPRSDKGRIVTMTSSEGKEMTAETGKLKEFVNF